MDYVTTGDTIYGGASITWTKGEELRKFFGESRIFAVADRDTWRPEILSFDRGSDYWQMGLAHEWGHCLVARFKPRLVNDTMYHRVGLYALRFEVLAWRLAKSFLDPALWDEKHALECLETHWQKTFGYGTKLPAKLGIVPYERTGRK